jgi:hypothetical protein
MFIRYFKVRKRSVNFSFAWAGDLCRKIDAGFGYVWSEPTCIEQDILAPVLIDFGFAWKEYDGLVCRTADQMFTYGWSQPNCTQTGSDPDAQGGFEYELELVTE